ncbi:MAG: RagB/SusD family nutrient uptake outer membrane protein [Paludibacter sp.]
MKIYTLAAILLCLFALNSCTSGFEEMNTNPLAMTNALLKNDFQHVGAFFPQMQKSIYYNNSNGNWEYQLQQNLNADVYSGYLTPPSAFNNGKNNTNYYLMDGWNVWPFKIAMENIMAPWKEVQKLTKSDLKDFYGVALILKVAGMHRLTDIYGPIPYSKYGQGGTKVLYDKQEDIYNQFFQELDTAVVSLTDFVKINPGVKPFIQFDRMYNGDYVQWIKWANTLRLRLAMRISNVDNATAKVQAEKAVNNEYGVFMVNDDRAKITDSKVGHPLIVIADAWGDIRMGANMESILVGYGDPRLPKYFSPATDTRVTGQYKGIRYGIDIISSSQRVGYSNLGPDFKLANRYSQEWLLMTTAEAYFLRAEGALRGWNMKGTVKDLYEQGVQKSFEQWGVSNSYDAYIANQTNTPANYTDPQESAYNINAVSSITINWDETASKEIKLERIITQKWISMFPEGEEAWAEFRRTGFPRLFPMVANYSSLVGQHIDSQILIRRLPFSSDEYRDNADAVSTAASYLKGGKDDAGARLWWDMGENKLP